MKRIIQALFVGLNVMILISSCADRAFNALPDSVDHELWDNLLKDHVNEEGLVDYPGFKKDIKFLNGYLDMLSRSHPNATNWSREQRLAYWINAYNAFTVKMVVDHYPVKSVKDIKRGIPFFNSARDKRFIKIEGARYNLNNIEHDILRKEFDEPRIHFAINGASVSSPLLSNEAFTAEKIETQLENAAKIFLSDKNRNIISSDEARLSKIFSWFEKDFIKNGTLIDFINRYAPIEVNSEATIEFLEYDWSLNGEE